MTDSTNTISTAVHTECLQHSAARLLAVLGTATACIPLVEGSDSLILVGLPEQIAKLLPAAANKAAEEGELPSEGILYGYFRKNGKHFDKLKGQPNIHTLNSGWIPLFTTKEAADRAARPVANKAEVEQDAARYQFLRHADLDEMKRIYWPEGEVPSGAEFDAAIDHALGCVATPPATTGASTAGLESILDRLENAIGGYSGGPFDKVQAIIDELRAAPDCGACPGDGSMCKSRCKVEQESPASTVLTDERINTQRRIIEAQADEIAALKTAALYVGSEVAAQAGQVAVPEGWTITKESNVITVEHPAVGKSTLASLAIESASQFVLYHLADCLLAPSPAKESK